MTELWLEELAALERDLGPLRPMLMRWRRRVRPMGAQSLLAVWLDRRAGDRAEGIDVELYPPDARVGDRPLLIVPVPGSVPLRQGDQAVRVAVAGAAAPAHAAALVLPDGRVVFCAGAARRPSPFDRSRWRGTIAESRARARPRLRRRSRAEGAAPSGGSHPS